MPEYADYKDALVVFVDILGFSDAVWTIHDRDSFLRVALVVAFLREQTEKWSTSLQSLVRVSITAVSDSVIISIPYSDPACAYALMVFIGMLQFQLVAYLSTLTRGYIAKGHVFHQDGLVFGTGYLNACCGERAVAGPPRVVVAPTVVDLGERAVRANQQPGMKSVFELLRRDPADGLFFVDYLNPAINLAPIEVQAEERHNISVFVDSALRSYPEGSIRRKYVWLREYLDSSGTPVL
jgi:hypothetical protein